MSDPASQAPAHRDGLSLDPLDRISLWFGPLLVVGLLLSMASFDDQDRPQGAMGAAWVMMTSLPWALFWMIGAIGLGRPIRRWLVPHSENGLAIQCGTGVALLLFLDNALGVSGLLQAGGSIGAWSLLILGSVMAADQYRHWLMMSNRPSIKLPWIFWAASPAIALLFVATCSAPGGLWDSEFGGYDALSYHLQLPKEWMSLGSIAGLDHNVYSHMPNFMEGAYYHLALLQGDGIESVYASQMLHALITLLTAFITYRLATKITTRLGGLVAAVVLLGTPWVIVTGSLAYNEMTVTLLLVTGLLVLFSNDLDAPREAALLGILMGAACGAKLTAIGFVALPLISLLLWKQSFKQWHWSLVIMGLVGTVVLAPYLLMNWSNTANPVFPFLTSVFGTGHWTPEQVAIWSQGHQVEGGVLTRLTEFIHQFVRYGIGPSPYENEPWKPQWSILPWLGGLALGMSLLIKTHRSTTGKLLLVMLLQLSFWILFTHVKSRFLLPMVVPLALCVAIAVAWFQDFASRNAFNSAFKPLCFASMLTWCCVPVFLASSERRGHPGAMIDMAMVMSGRSLTDPNNIQSSAQLLDSVYLNRMLDADAKVLLVGHATPLYFDRPVIYQTTWDRGPFSRIMRESDDSASWFEALSVEGFTHLLVQPEMLRVWENSGWNDPLITADRILIAADQHATIEWRFPNGIVLYRLALP